MLHLVCDLHASKRNAAVFATVCDWKGAWPGSPPLDPPVVWEGGSDPEIFLKNESANLCSLVHFGGEIHIYGDLGCHPGKFTKI